MTAPADVAGGVAIIRARGDLDCDGETSLFELPIGKDAAGALTPSVNFEIQDKDEIE